MKNPLNIARQAALAGAGLFLLGVGAAPSAAQTQASPPRWETWVGCWEPTQNPADTAAEAVDKPVTCVVPAGTAAVDVVTVVDGKVEHRERVQAGERRRIERGGCSGWETVTGSADARRAFRQSEFTCEGDLQRRSTGVMAMAGEQWLDVTGVTAGGYTDVQVVRYGPVAAPDALPAADREALRGRAMAVEASRLASAAPVTTDEVVEALRYLSPEVVEAWLVERGQGFAMDADKLVQLAEAGVPERVIDLMVALSYPDVFAVNRDAREGHRRPDPNDRRTVRPRPIYGWGYPGYGWGGYYPGYGYGGYGGYWGSPVIVRRDPDEGSSGRAVKGRGYTRGGSGSGGSVTTSRNPSGSRSGTASGSGGASSGGSSGSTRKAKPRGGE